MGEFQLREKRTLYKGIFVVGKSDLLKNFCFFVSQHYKACNNKLFNYYEESVVFTFFAHKKHEVGLPY